MEDAKFYCDKCGREDNLDSMQDWTDEYGRECAYCYGCWMDAQREQEAQAA